MCGHVKQHNKDVYLGSQVNFMTNEGVANGHFGIKPLQGDYMYNARIETLSTKWKRYIDNRGVLMVDGFVEKDSYFHFPEGKQIAIPVLYDDNYDIVIITKGSTNVVVPYHNRMPAMISDVGRWLKDRYFTTQSAEKLLREEAA